MASRATATPAMADPTRFDGPSSTSSRSSTRGPSMKSRTVCLLTLPLACVVAAGIAALVGGCNRQAPAMGMGAERPPSPVTVATAVAKDVPVYLDEIGKCTAVELVTVQPQ